MPSYVRYPQRDTKVVSFRIPKPLYHRLMVAAAAEGKSLNAYGIAKLATDVGESLNAVESGD